VGTQRDEPSDSTGLRRRTESGTLIEPLLEAHEEDELSTGTETEEDDRVTLQDRVDDALDASCQDSALMGGLLEEARQNGHRHPSVDMLAEKCARLTAQSNQVSVVLDEEESPPVTAAISPPPSTYVACTQTLTLMAVAG
jgi:hypothetical protein